MTEVWVGVIAAVAALGGSFVAGWFGHSAGARQAEAARHAGDRQAEAAQHAGDRQADALLESVRLTIRAEARQRALALRRQVYGEFLVAAEAAMLAERTGRGGPDDSVRLQGALGAVVLEGPAEVSAAARLVVDGLRRHVRPDELADARDEFVAVAQRALIDPAADGGAADGGPAGGGLADAGPADGGSAQDHQG
ncbi:hypothetical protein QIS99_25945 [Streptomyces sp. B-S-A8]|uniref:Uncharacterized protein n=1 Tax=Streptomyces solicavernae TaxID=3043614 RepID=A0ABT6S0V7_9ACTN|nr:hypothetical protein [Streptomyces sp. B-S-A8]MDI3389603.1 hypothetical protein [Streptomyces sp. B-S-A8]